MATQTTKIGFILRAGNGFEARPIGQSPHPFRTEGEARDFFRRFAGNGPQTNFSQGIVRTNVIVTFVPDTDPSRVGIEDVFLSYQS
jgi:hypothetical protein